MRNGSRGETALPLIGSLAEAVRQAERIRSERAGSRFRRQLRKSNSSVQEWVRVPTPTGDVYVSAKMGGHVWDSLDNYYRSAKEVNAGYAVRAFVALGARPALAGEADHDAIEAQIGQRVRRNATILVFDGPGFDGGPARPVEEQPRVGPAAPARVQDTRRRVGAAAARRAKLFRSGRAQLVHLPEGFGFDGEEVRIRRQGEAVVLEPVPADWAWLDALAGEGLDADFRRAVEEREGDAEDRPAMERLFPR